MLSVNHDGRGQDPMTVAGRTWSAVAVKVTTLSSLSLGSSRRYRYDRVPVQGAAF
jgi:hypothetical protein